MRKKKKSMAPKDLLRRISIRKLTFIGVFILAGLGLLFLVNAATPVVHFEAESAPQLAGVQKLSDSGASGGSYLQFGSGETTPPPSPTGRPGANNTGPTSANLTVMSSGQVVNAINAGTRLFQGVYIKGQVTIPKGPTGTVTFRNFVIDGGESTCGKRDANGVVVQVPGVSCYGLQNCYNTSGCMSVIMEDGEIKNVSSAAVLANNYTARRLEIHESGGDGFKILGSNILIERSWGHHMGKEIPKSVGNFGSPHADFAQAQSPAGSNVIIRYNYCNFEMSQLSAPYHSNACYIGDSSRAAVNIDIYGNWLSGGNYTINCYDISTVKVHDNIFSRDYRYGIKSSCPGPWTNNKYEDGSPA